MATFQFQLEPLLKHRRMLEDASRRELAELLNEQSRLQQRVADLQRTISDDKRQMAAALAGHVDVGRIRQHAAHANQATSRARQIVLELAALQRRIDQARLDVQQRARQRRAIELLRDRRLAQWRRQQDRRERIEQDEIGTQRYARRSEQEVSA